MQVARMQTGYYVHRGDLRQKEVRVVLRRISFVLLAAVTLAAMSGALAYAQSGVKGLGYIRTSNTNIASLDINVVKVGDIMNGGFRYTEVNPVSPSVRPITVIYSQRLLSIDVRGNFATVKAVGLWNGMPSNLLVEVLDDNPSGDWMHIRAIPIKSMLPVIYDAAGGVFKGDLTVFSSPAITGYAVGEGAIGFADRNSIGKFAFKAEVTNAGVRGTISYAEYAPFASAITRPRAIIYVPMVQSLEITGNTAVLKGKGTLNGRPAAVEVKAVDNSMLMGPIIKPDEFYIKAVTLVGSTDVPQMIYEAGGPLKMGDIKVVSIQ